jgi:hypothetical protein
MKKTIILLITMLILFGLTGLSFTLEEPDGFNGNEMGKFF